MGNLASLTLRMGADISQFQTKMRQVSNTMKKTGAQMKSIGKNMSMFITAPLVAAGGYMVKSASDAQESESKFNTVFSSIQQNAKAAMLELNKSYGLSRVESTKLLASTGVLLTGFGFAQDEALNLSTEVQKLAVDLASFTNYSGGSEGASEALTKALLGERESVKALGISIQEADVKKQMAINSANGMVFATERQAKAYATLQLAQKQSKNAIGDFARTQNSFANTMRVIKGNIEDLAAGFGKVLLPIATKIAQHFKTLTEHFQKLSTKGKKTIAIVAAIVAAIGPLTLALGSVLTVLPAIGAALAALTGPIGIVIAAIAAIAAAFIYVYGNWQAFKERLSSWAWLKNAAIDAFIFLIKASSYFLNEITKLFGIDFVSPMVDTLENLKGPVDDVKTEFKSFGQTFKDVSKDTLQALGFLSDGTEKTTNKMAKGYEKLARSAQKAGAAIKKLAPRSIPKKGAISGEPETLPAMELPAIETDEFDNSIENVKTKLSQLKEMAQAVSQAIAGAISDFANRAVDSLGLAAHGFQGFLGVMLRTAIKLITILLAESIGNAITGATQSGTATGPAAAFTTPAFIATAVGGVIAAFAQIPKLATGGIIPPGFSNDSYPAWLSSGEMVVPAPRPLQASIGGNQTINVNGILRGSGKDLFAVLDNYGQRISRITGA